jgi:hypothetical protein
MEKYLTLLFILLCNFNMAAQGPHDSFPRLIVKYMPFNVLDYPQPSVQFGLEYALARRHSLQAEYGQIIISKLVEGYRLRGEYRYYIPNEKKGRDFYLGLQYSFRKTNTQEVNTFSRNNGTYFQTISYNRENVFNGLTAGFGNRYLIGNRLVIDWGMAFGIRRLEVRQHGVPPDAELASNDDFELFPFTRAPGVYALPSWLIRLGIGIALW